MLKEPFSLFLVQVHFSQHWKNPDRVALLGTRCIAQMVHCIECCERNIWRSCGVEKVTEITELQRNLTEMNAYGEVKGLKHTLTLDETEGFCTTFDQETGQWVTSFNVGLVRHVHRRNGRPRVRTT